MIRIWITGTTVVGTGETEIDNAVPFDFEGDAETEARAFLDALPAAHEAHWDGMSWWSERIDPAPTLLRLLVPDANALGAPDAQALIIADYYPAWDAAVAYSAGTIANLDGGLWRCVADCAGEKPGEGESWKRVGEE